MEQDKKIENGIELDDRFVDALKIAVERKSISIFWLQRACSIGYPRACRILEQMEKLGYVSADNENSERQVYLTQEQFDEQYGEEY